MSLNVKRNLSETRCIDEKSDEPPSKVEYAKIKKNNIKHIKRKQNHRNKDAKRMTIVSYNQRSKIHNKSMLVDMTVTLFLCFVFLF